MKIEDIKVGKTYLLPFEVIKINDTDIHMRNGGVKGIFQPEELTESSRKSAPKYDPCRKFRKGDKVRFKEYLGRRSLAHTDEYITLDRDEKHGQCFWTGVSATGDIWSRNAYFCYLELVEPAEELVPYYIERRGEKEGGWCYIVYKHGGYAESTFYFGACRSRNEAEAKEAAEAERDRLNDEWRKEQEQ
jgi:hypothetical protein